MKRIFLIFAGVFFTACIYAQVPDKISYQAIIRDANKDLVKSQNVGIRISILQGSANGTAVYIETHIDTTNTNGLLTIIIGEGTVVTGTFSTIDWALGPYFLKTETDPSGGTSYDINGVSQLMSVPYALYAKTTNSYAETDPIFSAHAATLITTANITNWNTAYGWGNHATQGYLTSLSETDPVFNLHAASGITSNYINNWNAAYGWGNHAGLYRPIGYIPAWSEITSKPNFATVATSGNFNDLTNKPITLSGYGITDAMNTSHSANGITSANINNWNTAYGWGNHATQGYLTSLSETDPIFSAHVANGITSNNINNWNTAYSWGNHAGLYRPISYVPAWSGITGKPTFATVANSGNFSDLTSKPTTLSGYGITDAMSTSHAANGITASNITNWNTAYGWGNHAIAGYLSTESDPQVGTNSNNYIPHWNGTSLVTGSIWDNGTNIGIGASNSTSYLVYVNNQASSGDANGIYSLAHSTTSRAIYGWASAISGITYGLYGEASSAEGGVGTYGRAPSCGMWGEATSTSGTNFGVYGKSNSSSGYDFYAAGAGTDYGSASSIRWKSNIKNIENVLTRIKDIRGVYFDWDEEHGGGHDLGFIGEEVMKQFPEIVAIDPDNSEFVTGMDYSKMTPILLQAIKEQQKLIEELENRIEVLEKKLK